MACGIRRIGNGYAAHQVVSAKLDVQNGMCPRSRLPRGHEGRDGPSGGYGVHMLASGGATVPFQAL